MIGIRDGTGWPMTGTWMRDAADGTIVDGSMADLPVWGIVQLNAVFGGEAPVEGGDIDVWTETESAAFTADGSVLDTVRSDPTRFVPQSSERRSTINASGLRPPRFRRRWAGSPAR